MRTKCPGKKENPVVANSVASRPSPPIYGLYIYAENEEGS
jgi:hypothetical protein